MKQHLVGVFFITCILIISALSLLAPKQTQSLRENRTLATTPSLSFSSVRDGSFQRDYTTYVNDHFYQRVAMREVKSTVERALQVKKMEDVYIGNTHLFQEQLPANPQYLHDISAQMKEFAQAHEDVKMTSIIVPNKGTILQNELPEYAPIHKQDSDILAFYERIEPYVQTLDALQSLSMHKEEELFYKSDHHWTTLGAYRVFESFYSLQKFDHVIEYEQRILNDRFYGTLAKATGLNVYDDLHIFTPIEDEIQTVVTYVDEQKKTISIYDLDKQYTSNPYEVFLGGNHALVEITTTSTNDRSLLLLKDSYANAFLPFLLPYYHQITIVDPRYYYDNLSQLLRVNGIDEVLFLYNANTFFTDTSLLDLLREE